MTSQPRTFGDMPLTVDDLTALGAKAIDQRVARFKTVHGRMPSESSTLREWFMLSARAADRLWLIIRVVAPQHPERAWAINRASVQTAVSSAKQASEMVRKVAPRNTAAQNAIDAAVAFLGAPTDASRDRAFAAAIRADNAARQAHVDGLDERVVSAIDACGWTARAAADQFNDATFYAHAALRTVEYELGIMVMGVGVHLERLINDTSQLNG